VDAAGIVNPRRLFLVFGAGGPGLGIVLSPLMGDGDLGLIVSPWIMLADPLLEVECRPL